MARTVETRLEIKSWDEQPYRELDDGRKFTRTDVVLTGADAGADDAGDGLEGEATWSALMYYAADGTSSYVGLMQITGRLDGRSGSFVLSGTGSYDGTTARGESTVVPGSATDELAGLTGSSLSVSTHADYPHMPLKLTYDLP